MEHHQGRERTVRAFFPELLDSFTGMDFIGRVCAEFHYEEKDVSLIRDVAEEMLPLMRGEACWERCTPWERRAPWEAGGEEKPAAWEGVVVTLGEGLDRLQESYHDRGLLSESYMLEALAGELLLQSYRAYNDYVGKEGGWHVARYHFPGSEEKLPLEKLPQILARFSAPVSCNKAFCLLPKKSVVFLAELTQDEAVRCEGICACCGREKTACVISRPVL